VRRCCAADLQQHGQAALWSGAQAERVRQAQAAVRVRLAGGLHLRQRPSQQRKVGLALQLAQAGQRQRLRLLLRKRRRAGSGGARARPRARTGRCSGHWEAALCVAAQAAPALQPLHILGQEPAPEKSVWVRARGVAALGQGAALRSSHAGAQGAVAGPAQEGSAVKGSGRCGCGWRGSWRLPRGARQLAAQAGEGAGHAQHVAAVLQVQHCPPSSMAGPARAQRALPVRRWPAREPAGRRGQRGERGERRQRQRGQRPRAGRRHCRGSAASIARWLVHASTRQLALCGWKRRLNAGSGWRRTAYAFTASGTLKAS
jgi:hypothetical protein